MGYFDDMPTSSSSSNSSPFADMPSSAFADMPSEGEGLWEGLIKPTLKAVPRVVAHTAASFGQMPISGVAAAAKYISSGGDLSAANQVLEENQKTLDDFYLKTPEEKQGSANIGLAMSPFQMAGEGWQEIIKQTPLKGTIAEPIAGAIGEASAMFGLGGAKGAIKGRLDTAFRPIENVIPETQGRPVAITPETPKSAFADMPSEKPYSDQLNSDVDILDTKIEQIKVADVSPASKEIAIKSLEKRKQGLIDNAVKQGEIVQPRATSFDVYKTIEPNIVTSSRSIEDLFTNEGMRREFAPITDVQVKVVDSPGLEKGSQGMFDDVSNTVYIKSGLTKEGFDKALNHEMIHALDLKAKRFLPINDLEKRANEGIVARDGSSEVDVSFYRPLSEQQIQQITSISQGKTLIFDDYSSGKLRSGEGLSELLNNANINNLRKGSYNGKENKGFGKTNEETITGTKNINEGIRTTSEKSPMASNESLLGNKAQEAKPQGLSAEMQNANATLQLMRDIRKNGKINTKNLDSAFGKNATDQLKKMGLASDNGKIWYDILAQEHNLDANEMMQSLLDYKKTSITKAKEVQYLKEKYNAELKAAKIDPGEIEASSGDLRASLEAKGYSSQDIESAFKELADERAAIQGEEFKGVKESPSNIPDKQTVRTGENFVLQVSPEEIKAAREKGQWWVGRDFQKEIEAVPRPYFVKVHDPIRDGYVPITYKEQLYLADKFPGSTAQFDLKPHSEMTGDEGLFMNTKGWSNYGQEARDIYNQFKERYYGNKDVSRIGGDTSLPKGMPDSAGIQGKGVGEKKVKYQESDPRQPSFEGLSPEEIFTLNNPTTEISKPLSKQTTPKNSSLFSDINTIMGGERGSISSKGLSPEQLAAKERLDVAFEKFKEEAKKAGKEFGEYIKEVGLNEKAIAYFNSRNKEQGIGKIETKPETGKERGLAKNTEDESIRAGLVEDRGELGDLPKYIERDPKAAQEVVTKLMEEDYPRALRIAEGKEKAPDNIFPEDVFTGIRVKAELNGDVNTITRLLDSPLVAEATKLGQRIQALSTANADSPFAALKGIIKERTEAMKSQGKTPVSSAKVVELEKALADKQKAFDEYVAKVEEKKVKDALDETVKPKYKPVNKIKYGSQNKVVTEAAYLKAKATLREKFAQQTAGIDPTIIKELSEVGAYHLEAGTREFAQWSKRVIEDVGDWAKPHLEDVFKQVKGDEKKVTAGTFAKRITKAMEEGKDTPDIGIFVQKLAKQLVSEGITDRDVLVREVHNILKDIIPEITPRETADAISGYGKYKQLSKDEISVQLRDLKGQLQQVSKLDDLESKGTAKKTGVERRIPSDEERRLMKLVDEAKKKYGIDTIDPETQLRTKQDALKKRLVNEIKDLSDKFKNMDFAKKETIKIIPDVDALKLKAERDIAKKILKVAQEASVTPTKEQVGKLIELSKTTKDLKTVWEAKIKEQGGSGETYWDLFNWDKTNVKKFPERFQYGAAKQAYENYINDLRGANAPIGTLLKERAAEAKATWEKNKALAVADVAKDSAHEIIKNSQELVGSTDDSFIGRQGLFTLATHPTRWVPAAMKSFVDFAKVIGGKNAQDALMAKIYSDPLYLSGEFQKAGILERFEEAHPTSHPGKIPVVGRIIRASSDSFTNAGLNMRIETYKLLSRMAKKNGIDMMSGKQAEGIGTLINSLTYKGKWGKTGVSPWVRLVMWAPNILKGQYDILTAHSLGAGLPTAFARKEAFKNLGKIIAEAVAIATIANAIKPGSAETNPTSSAFGTIKGGDTYFDYTGGLRQLIIMPAKILTGESKNPRTGEITKQRFGMTGWNTVTNFFGNKFNPAAAIVRDRLKGEFFSGEKFNWMQAWYNAQTPISIQNVVSLKDKDSPARRAGVAADIVGIGAINFDKKVKKRAEGGEVKAGNPYIMGEKGTELLTQGDKTKVVGKQGAEIVVPKRKGKVIPHKRNWKELE